MGAVARKGANWFTKPKNDLMSVREGLLGILKSRIAVSLSSVGLYLSQPMRKPTNVASLWQNLNFSGFKVMPFHEQVSRKLFACQKAA